MFRALFFALVGFAAMTLASMAGFAFVITGPPTGDERAAVERVLARAAAVAPEEIMFAAKRIEKAMRSRFHA